MEGVSISGRKKSDGIDFYQTPQWVTKKLLDNISLSGTILEPASGSGAISKLTSNALIIVTDSTRYG